LGKDLAESACSPERSGPNAGNKARGESDRKDLRGGESG